MQGVVDEALNREVDKVQHDANVFKYYPVIALGVSYKF